MLRMRVRPEGFKRVRTGLGAIPLEAGDLNGPVLRLLDGVARLAAKQGIQSRGGGAWPALNPRYATWKARAGYGRRMMVMNKPYRGRKAQQLLRKFTMAGEAGHLARWNGRLRFSFGALDDVAFRHEHGEGVPRRSVIDSIYAARERFVTALLTYYRAHVHRVVRHL